ncbi:hypothetical protein Gocc_2401 [Gaiella occulta]|uniref:Histidine kinase-, DNA gyrase B-, and HSP90-like ATPase n=1 Tax=Gaiella occulta TaxID=1002870 RepID=A0A7M2YWJ4_9ACTN|nr:ATP-binding protein [Gaiella occulta]RDI73837.1 hypothetical protein Gocc_2401 [Gaiella occulta]
MTRPHVAAESWPEALGPRTVDEIGDALLQVGLRPRRLLLRQPTGGDARVAGLDAGAEAEDVRFDLVAADAIERTRRNFPGVSFDVRLEESVVRQVADAHGGTVRAEVAGVGGTQMRLTLPAGTPAPEVTEPPLATA